MSGGQRFPLCYCQQDVFHVWHFLPSYCQQEAVHGWHFLRFHARVRLSAIRDDVLCCVLPYAILDARFYGVSNRAQVCLVS